MKSSIPPLVEHLIICQNKLKLNNSEFARLLGISRPLWVMTKSGKRQINVSLLRGVAKTFPNLDMQILTFLRSTEGGKA